MTTKLIMYFTGLGYICTPWGFAIQSHSIKSKMRATEAFANIALNA